MQRKYSIGIDPGTVHCGVAVVKEQDEKISLVRSATINTKELGGHNQGIRHVLGFVNGVLADEGATPQDVTHLAIERFVSFNNLMTGESEGIVMLIGGLTFALDWPWIDTTLYRSIDWKTELVKLLVKNRGFDNPSTSLDKKFSIAAAHACLDVKGEFDNDHEADAICLASIGLLKARYTKAKNVPAK